MGAHITYAPREAIKSQVLPDFVVEWTEARLPPKPVDEEYWVMHFEEFSFHLTSQRAYEVPNPTPLPRVHQRC